MGFLFSYKEKEEASDCCKWKGCPPEEVQVGSIQIYESPQQPEGLQEDAAELSVRADNPLLFRLSRTGVEFTAGVGPLQTARQTPPRAKGGWMAAAQNPFRRPFSSTEPILR